TEIEKEKQNALNREDYEYAAALRDEELELENKAKQEISEEKLIVEAEHIHQIIETKTGIPVGKLQSDEQEKMRNIEKNLGKKVIGQDEAVKKVARAIRRSRAGLKAKNRPI